MLVCRKNLDTNYMSHFLIEDILIIENRVRHFYLQDDQRIARQEMASTKMK